MYIFCIYIYFNKVILKYSARMIFCNGHFAHCMVFGVTYRLLQLEVLNGILGNIQTENKHNYTSVHGKFR